MWQVFDELRAAYQTSLGRMPDEDGIRVRFFLSLALSLSLSLSPSLSSSLSPSLSSLRRMPDEDDIRVRNPQWPLPTRTGSA